MTAPSYIPSAPQRATPQNPEAERALLGGMLLDNRKISDVFEIIPTQATRAGQASKAAGIPSAMGEAEPLFSNPVNQEIFETIRDLWTRDRAVDLTTLGNELDKRNRYEAIGGAPYLASLELDLVSTQYVGDYARIVVEKWRLRTLLRVAGSIADEVRRSDEDPEQIIDRSAQKIFELSQQTEQRDFVHVGQIAADVMQEIEARAKQDDSGIVGVPSGFEELDKMTTGFRPANLIILAARPGMGKSAFAMNIAAHNAVRHGRAVGIFSLEMSKEELNQRLMCTLGRVPLGKIRANRLSRDDMDELHNQAIRLGQSPIYIDDSSDLSILELRAKARRLKMRVPNLSLLVIDYLQLAHAAGIKTDNRQQEVATISRSLKVLAGDLQVPIIALSQLSRESEKRGGGGPGKGKGDKLPKLSDLRESGAIEQDADMVIFIHREFRVGGGKEEAERDEPDLATIRVAKQRNGPTGDFNLLFRGKFTQFVDLLPEAMGARSH